MSSSTLFDSVDRLAEKLPFQVSDVERVNSLFEEYRSETRCPGSGGEAGEEVTLQIELWTYCYVRRYFLAKCAQDSSASPADLEQLIESAFKKIRAHRQTLRSSRYASWVSVVCKNCYLNYIRSRKVRVRIDYVSDASDLIRQSLSYSFDEASVHVGEVHAAAFRKSPSRLTPSSVVAAGYQNDDNIRSAVHPVGPAPSSVAHSVVARAIQRLPDFLREVARLKLLNGLTYEQISDQVDKPVPILRAYVYKIVRRLRTDSELLEFFDRR